MSDARIEHLETHGTFSLDGGTWEVDNNIWLVGNDDEVLVIDPAHDADAVVTAVGERNVLGILLTHGHDDHIRSAVETARKLDAHLYLHPADHMLWEAVHETLPDFELADQAEFVVAGTPLTVLHTPGHSPGSVSVYAPALGAVFTGDTLFQGGPGATGRSYSDFPTIVDSISKSLLTLPGETVVYPGHGAQTTVADEAPHVQEWIDRGH
ncbi:MBL fold metallo-hydrolase [Leucobacter tardus]|uniref:MBL fold metallo-hydrolase n=1 Tax=Leucobacter tardus TaxID=501483 RepID=A0A939QFG4_9MICO|nr:MBL fold metallo-hydrolase [Leucobacter tardus]MBO2990862.1 MBL fold metallo-hydrolase [Leucobacter tardus]